MSTYTGEGDIPTLRMLHDFGMSVSIGDYDDRYPLHLAAAGTSRNPFAFIGLSKVALLRFDYTTMY